MSGDFVKGKAKIEAGKVDTDLVHVLIPLNQQPARHLGKQRWALLFLDPCRELAKLNLSGQDWQVLMTLLSYMDFGNRIAVVQSTIAADLGIQPSRVSEAIKKLLSLSVLVEDTKVGGSRVFRLNAKYAYRGKTKNVRAKQSEDKEKIARDLPGRHATNLLNAEVKAIEKAVKPLADDQKDQARSTLASAAINKIDDDYCSDQSFDPERFDIGASIIARLVKKYGVPSPF